MKVFLSWSGERSQNVAIGLRDWLPCVIQQLEPWLSSSDIPAGGQWVAELSEALANSQAGIVCVTRDNINSAWLNFESGSLSRGFDRSLICVYLVGVNPSELTGPLAQFQCTKAESENTLRY